MTPRLRIVAISDTHDDHLRLGGLPAGDVLVHCGDMTEFGHVDEFLRLATWMGQQPHQTKVAIGGNHDDALAAFLGKKNRERVLKAFADAGVAVLERAALELASGVKLWASPAVNMRQAAFGMKDEAAARAEWAKIPSDASVVVTHVPPLGILDLGLAKDETGQFRGPLLHFGCAELARRLTEVAPALHLFGHIHGTGGKAQLVSYRAGKCLHVNAAVPRGKVGGVEALGRPVVVDLLVEEDRIRVELVEGELVHRR